MYGTRGITAEDRGVSEQVAIGVCVDCGRYTQLNRETRKCFCVHEGHAGTKVPCQTKRCNLLTERKAK